LGEIVDLEHDSHGWLELDDLATVEAELLIVIEYCVHVLDPDCINWTIENDPLSVYAFRFSAVPDLDGEHAVGPLLCVHVEDTVQLVLGDTLWVDEEALDIHILGVVLDGAHCLSKDLDNRGFTGIRVANDHEAVPDHDRFVKLDAFLEEAVCWLEVATHAGCFHLGVELSVVLRRQCDTWE